MTTPDKCHSNSAANWAGAIWAESFRRDFANLRSLGQWLRCMIGLRDAGWCVKGKCDE